MLRKIAPALLVLGIGGALPMTAPVAAQPTVNGSSPALPNSSQRRAILNALRPAIERKLGQGVEFVVDQIKVGANWALVIAEPKRRGGRRINAARHFSAEEIDRMDGLTVNAVLRFRNGKWWLVDHAIGPTDVWYCGVEGLPRVLTNC